MLLSLSALPPIFVACAAAWAFVYSAYLSREDKATYFVVFHIHWLRWLPISAVLLLAGVISLFLDGRSAAEK